jgi:hypothetical protein
MKNILGNLEIAGQEEPLKLGWLTLQPILRFNNITIDQVEIVASRWCTG